MSVRLPDGASLQRTEATTKKIENIVGKLPGVQDYLTLGGLDIATQTSNSNVATVIAALKPWMNELQSRLNLSDSRRRTGRIATVPEAFTFSFAASILGLSTTGGFHLMLEDRAATT